MGKLTAGTLYAVVLAGVVVAVDLLFFRNHVWERLAVNVGIVLVFAAFYFRFLNRRYHGAIVPTCGSPRPCGGPHRFGPTRVPCTHGGPTRSDSRR
jgi:protein-S-isoprenylcysteine O-methyltransferase Ste14